VQWAKACDHLVKDLLPAHYNWAYFLFGFPDEVPEPLLSITIKIGLYSYVSEKVSLLLTNICLWKRDRPQRNNIATNG
jgi:hypothetical protein